MEYWFPKDTRLYLPIMIDTRECTYYKSITYRAGLYRSYNTWLVLPD